MNTVLPDWIDFIDEKILSFLSSLQIKSQPGRFLPCLRGVTEEGKKAALGFSCFALKIFFMLGQWNKLEKKEQDSWIFLIKSFQNNDSVVQEDPIKKNAFIDPALITHLESNGQPFFLRSLLKEFIKPSQNSEFLTNTQRVIIAETKQALATLAEVGESSEIPYSQFPKTPGAVSDYMGKFDWTQPWGAGGQVQYC